MEEKEVIYDDAQELMQHFENKAMYSSLPNILSIISEEILIKKSTIAGL